MSRIHVDQQIHIGRMTFLASCNRAEDADVSSPVPGGYLNDLVTVIAEQFSKSGSAASPARQRLRPDPDACGAQKSVESLRGGNLGG